MQVLSSWRKGQSGLLSGGSKVVLQKLWQEDGAPIKYHAENEAEEYGGSEVSSSEKPQVHNRIPERDFADHQRYQGENGHSRPYENCVR